MKTRSLIAVSLCAIMILAAFSACTKAEAENARILDFRASEDVTPAMKEDPEEASLYVPLEDGEYPDFFFGGLRDDSYVVADDAVLAELTGLEFPSPDGAITVPQIKTLFAAAEKCFTDYRRVVLADGSNRALKTLTEDEIRIITDDVGSLSVEKAGEMLTTLVDQDQLTSLIFWEILHAYLPEGAVNYMKSDFTSNSYPTAWAIMDIGRTGFKSIDEILASRNNNRDYLSYGFDSLEINSLGYITYNDASENKSEDLLINPERVELIRILGDYLSD